MNEIDLIVKWLERHGSVVLDVVFHQEVIIVSGDEIHYLGAGEGYNAQEVYFFGNVMWEVRISGVVVLTNRNLINLNLDVDIKGRVLNNVNYVPVGVNCGLNLLGDGKYEGVRRMYGVGGNKFSCYKDNIGAATYSGLFMFDGYLFKMR